jgi:hypothetical protein
MRAGQGRGISTGVAEAVQELEQGDTTILAPAVADLRRRLQALPPPEPDKPRQPPRAA